MKIENKISFIRQSLDYLKLVRNNQYCHDIKIIEVENDDHLFECQWMFKPLKKGSIKLRMFIVDDPMFKKSKSVLLCYQNRDINRPSNLVDDYFYGFMYPKCIHFEFFKEFIEGIHDWIIDLIAEQKHHHVLDVIKKYIPESYISYDELENYVKSRKGLKKYNL